LASLSSISVFCAAGFFRAAAIAVNVLASFWSSLLRNVPFIKMKGGMAGSFLCYD